MKIHSIVFAFSILLISSKSLSYESYDFSPMDGNEYMGSDDNYNDSSKIASNEESQTRYKKNYLGYSKINDSHYDGVGKMFVFDPKKLRWFAYYKGNLINTGRASGGRFYCPDIKRGCKTPVGVFRIGHKGGSDCKSSKYPIGKGNAPMPWCMFFHGGYAIHGSWQVPGYNASHGCIRVPPPDARWLNQNFLNAGTTVVVKGYH